MSYISQNNILNEFLNLLRNSDILDTTQRNVTTITDSFTSSNTGIETFVLNKSNAKNIRSVSYDTNSLTYGTDYTIDIDNYSVTLLNVVPGKTIEITYDYGIGDHIYPDYPRLDLTISSFPRIGFGIYGFTSEIAGFGKVLNSAWRFDVRVYAISSKQADTMIDALRKVIIDNYTSLKYCSYIYPGNVKDLGMYDLQKGKNKIYVKGIDVFSSNNYEIN